MKNGKTLVAAAAAAMLAVPASHAAIDDAGMQYTSAAEGFYGSLRMDFSSSDKSTPGAADTDSAGLDVSASRLGVRGTVDLGGGLSAGYNYEFAVNGNNGAAIGTTRLHNVGLSGGFGSVLVGTQWALDYNYVWSKTDVMNVNSGWFTYNANRAGRQSNAITYTSPDFNGFNFGLSAVLSKGSLEIGSTELYVDGEKADSSGTIAEAIEELRSAVLEKEMLRAAADRKAEVLDDAVDIADKIILGLDLDEAEMSNGVASQRALALLAVPAVTTARDAVATNRDRALTGGNYPDLATAATAAGTAATAAAVAYAATRNASNLATLDAAETAKDAAETARDAEEARLLAADTGYMSAVEALATAEETALGNDVGYQRAHMNAAEAAEAAEAAFKEAMEKADVALETLPTYDARLAKAMEDNPPMFTSEEAAAIDKFVIASGYSFKGFNIAGTYVRRDVSTVNARYDFDTADGATTATFTEVSTNPNSIGLALGYGQDNWSLGYYYAKTDMDTPDNNEQLVHSFAGQMGIGKTTLRALYETLSDEANGRQDKDTDFWTLEAQYDLGSRSRVYAEYSLEEIDNPNDSSESSDQNVFLVGYRVDF